MKRILRLSVNGREYEVAVSPHRTLLKVLREGLSLRGASPNSYVDAYGERGGYQNVFKVYGKIGETCWQCKKGEIQRIVVGGRGTFVCTNCQKQPKTHNSKPKT